MGDIRIWEDKNILLWDHHPGETLGTCWDHGNTLFVTMGRLGGQPRDRYTLDRDTLGTRN